MGDAAGVNAVEAKSFNVRSGIVGRNVRFWTMRCQVSAAEKVFAMRPDGTVKK